MIRQVRSEFSGRIATLTLDRPARRNALSADLTRELIDCAHELSARDDVDAVILAGAGGCFSAGADLKDESRWAGGGPLAERRESARLGLRMARAWEELPQLTIAAIEGYAVGGGLALALALDWRVIARDAFVSLPETSLGIPLTWGTLPRLINLVGPSKTKRLANGVLDKPRHSVRMTKETINAYAGIGAHAVSYMAHDQFELAAASPESRAARQAALKRRKS